MTETNDQNHTEGDSEYRTEDKSEKCGGERDAEGEDGCQARLGPGGFVQNFGLYPTSNGNPLKYFKKEFY